MSALSDADIAQLRARLLAWYDAVARDLPWRRTRDPYAIWVSEVMLQQTRVDTVLRYYARFLERFPSAPVLAAASEDAVMAAWSGLGYYRRARLLHSGVREVVARYGGQVPSAPEALRALPGVGRYTAGAIGSIAFELPEPIVDGNVARVLCRVLALEGAPEERALQAVLWDMAARLAQGPRPGALNQALMELGATVCSKHAPQCLLCPLREHCAAYAQGRSDELPRARVKKPPRPVALVALIARAAQPAPGRAPGEAVWLARGAGTLFGALWNLPTAEGRGRAAAHALLVELGLDGELATRPRAEIEHVLTHRHLSVQLWDVERARAPQPPDSLRAVALASLDELGVSSLTRKALAAAARAVATHSATASAAAPAKNRRVRKA
ncbi:MAG TPA: A/G-specific adenine glycosylase [Polyangiales bacterium]|nr:A/G-specific adenine glycosylase [Polyangiales bacterium]